MAEKIPGWLERVLLPQISDIKGEIRAVNGRIDALEGRMQGEFAAVHSEIKRLDERMDVEFQRMDSEFKRIDERMGGLEKRLELGDRIAMVESRVANLEARK